MSLLDPPPDSSRWYVHPLTGSPMQEDTYFFGDGGMAVTNPMPKGALEIDQAAYATQVGQAEFASAGANPPTVDP